MTSSTAVPRRVRVSVAVPWLLGEQTAAGRAAVLGLEPELRLPLDPALQGPLFKGLTGSQPERSTGGRGGLA